MTPSPPFLYPQTLQLITPLKVDTFGSLDGRGVWDTGEGEGSGKLHDVLLELGDEFWCLSRSRLEGLGKVLEELGSGLLLGSKGDLDDSVEELGDLLDILLDHGSGSKGGSTNSDTTWDKSGGWG